MADILYGLTGTGDWQTDARPKNWREMILRWYPNGAAPLTGLMSKMRTKVIDDPETNWWVEDFTTQIVDITGIYTEPTLTSALAATTSAAGTILYLKLAQADAQHFKAGHTVQLKVAGYPQVHKVALVTAVTFAGASSCLTVVLKQTDATVTGKSMVDADKVMIIGSSHPQGDVTPTAIAYQPDKLTNYTQISRTAVYLTRTAEVTKTRYGSPEYQRLKRDGLERHSMELEKALLFGAKWSGTGANGQAQSAMDGLVTFGEGNAPADNISNFATDYPATKWVDEGKAFLNTSLEPIFRYGAPERFAFAGSGAAQGLSDLAEMYGTVSLKNKATSYGLQVIEWVTNFGILKLKIHPLFNIDADLRHSIVIFNPANVEYCPLKGRDTHFRQSPPEKTTANQGTDAIQEEWLTECTAHWGIPEEYGILYNVGVDG